MSLLLKTVIGFEVYKNIFVLSPFKNHVQELYLENRILDPLITEFVFLFFPGLHLIFSNPPSIRNLDIDHTSIKFSKEKYKHISDHFLHLNSLSLKISIKKGKIKNFLHFSSLSKISQKRIPMKYVFFFERS